MELEILPINDIYSQTQIINTDMKYWHIYLNNNKEETKNNYITKENKIKIIKIILEPQINLLIVYLEIVDISKQSHLNHFIEII